MHPVFKQIKKEIPDYLIIFSISLLLIVCTSTTYSLINSGSLTIEQLRLMIDVIAATSIMTISFAGMLGLIGVYLKIRQASSLTFGKEPMRRENE